MPSSTLPPLTFPPTPSPADRAPHGVGIASNGEFMTGAAFCAFGLAFACGASGFDVGAGARWGPFYLPLLVGLLTALAGDLVMLNALSLRQHARPLPRAALALLAIIGGNLLFAATLGAFTDLGLPPLGLLCGIYAAAFTLRLAGEAVRPAALAAFALALAFGSYLAFTVALGLSVPVWPTFVLG